MLNMYRYFTMGLREKVALIIAVIALLQVIIVSCSSKTNTLKSDSTNQSQKKSLVASHPFTGKKVYPYRSGPKTRSKQISDKSQEVIRKTFNFPDIEYPTASTPRPHFYLQETNILQRNPFNQPFENLSPKAAQNIVSSSTKNMKFKDKKLNKLLKFKKPNKLPEVMKTLPEVTVTPKPFSYKDWAFPEVEYPLSASDLWKSNNWNQILNYRPINIISNDEPNNFSQVSNLKPSRKSLKKILATSAVFPKPISSKKSKVKTTSAPAQVGEIKSITSCPSSYIDTSIQTPSISTPKKTNEEEEEPLLTAVGKNNVKDDCSTSHGVITQLPKDDLPILKTQDNLNNERPGIPISNGNINKLNTCPNTSNQTMSASNVVTPIPPNLNDKNSTTSPCKISTDDKTLTVSCDNKVASISDTMNTILSENTDNKVSQADDKGVNSNTSCDADEEFTTDVFPDFDENMLYVSTSTMSPMSLVDINEDWCNSLIIDPYKSVSYPDELVEYFIAIP